MKTMIMVQRRVAAFSRPFSRLDGPRELVRQFTPNWFTATMGTGILALALNQLPFRIAGMHDVACALWLVDIMLFVLFSTLYAARWIFFFDGARRILAHSVMSMFLGAIPMGLATIINGFLVFTRQEHSIEKMTAVWLMRVVGSPISRRFAFVGNTADVAASIHDGEADLIGIPWVLRELGSGTGSMVRAARAAVAITRGDHRQGWPF